METVVGVGEETRPKPCSPATVSAEQNDAVENGVRVSENGEHKAALVVDKESGVIEDCVMMNGVSSLLKLKHDVNDGKEEEEEHGYDVGDFVWGKIKNHPWWPGQVYDPSEASDLALKTKQQKGKKLLLVAYFGDGTFAWCGPSQLKPFAESFKECCPKVSSSRGSIVAAVEEAVEEMGRHMERLLLIRDCSITDDNNNNNNNNRRVVKNAGIREGVAVPDVRREVISALLVGKPEGILQDVKGFAVTVSFGGLLELEIARRKVSAFYRSIRGYGLIEFPESLPVPGLEDKNNDDEEEDEDDGGGAKRSTIERGNEEEALDSDDELLIQRPPLEKCSGFPDHRLQHRRKQKSIAEILENESCAVVRFEKGKSSRKKAKHEPVRVATTTNPRSRRMKEVAAVIGEDSKGKRKRKKRDEDEREEAEKKDEEADNDSTPLASLLKKAKVDAAASSAGNGVTSSTQTTKRERKKSKYFAPEFLSDFSSKGRKKTKTEPESSIVPSESQVGELMGSASNSLVVVEEEDTPREILLLENGEVHQELSEEVSNAVDFLRLGATTEEIRDLIRVSALGTEYPEDSSSRDMVREFMSIYRSFTYREGANSKLLGSYSTADTDKEDMNGTGKPEESEQTGKEENETRKKQRKPKMVTSKKQADGVEESRKEVSETAKKERKRRKPESEKKADEEEETLKESTKKERKAKKPNSEASGSTKKDKKAKKPKFKEQETPSESEKKEGDGKMEKQESEKEFSGAELFVTFGPGSSLPKKEALVEIYGKFGALDEERSCVSDSNFCACVAFLNVADGEKAFEASLESSPFASTSTARFRLKYPNERAGAGEKKGGADVPETKTQEMEHLKKKFEEMISLVDKSQGGFTEEVKVKLEEEMVNLLEEVRKMPLS
ncbi:Tudor/PWWP/MBT superfamily protein [Hirschfeldia incana]|nr:Tudor/PWWP/MBT superfamily protein [Hirschfeldia incana]